MEKDTPRLKVSPARYVGQAPAYLTELCHSINEIPARRNLRSATQVQLLVPRFRKERSGRVVVSPSHHRNCGTYFHLTFDSYTRSHNFSERDSKLIICIYYYYYFHTGAIMTPGIIRGIMGDVRPLGSTLVPGLLMIIYDATL